MLSCWEDYLMTKLNMLFVGATYFWILHLQSHFVCRCLRQLLVVFSLLVQMLVAFQKYFLQEWLTLQNQTLNHWPSNFSEPSKTTIKSPAPKCIKLSKTRTVGDRSQKEQKECTISSWNSHHLIASREWSQTFHGDQLWVFTQFFTKS